MQKTIVTCGKCENMSTTFNPCMVLSLPFESSLEKSISGFLKDEVLDKYNCENCKEKCKAKIKNQISQLPQYLVFHIKRFTYPSMKKIKGKVKYAPFIDMAK